MSNGLPESIDPVRLADEGARLEGDLPIGRFPRLAAMCVSPLGGSHVVLDFERTTDGKRFLRLQADAHAIFQCGRCLGDVAVRWRAASQLLIQRSAEAGREGDDSADKLIADGQISLRDVLEDELLLAVPMFPAHTGPCGAVPGGTADVGAGEDASPASGPFAALARLRKARK